MNSLNKKWKELVYAASGFGPNFLMVMMGAYFTDAINPAALGSGSLQAIGDTCLILPLVFPVLWMIAKVFDGLIDIPFASITDTLCTRWGRRRPAIAVSALPMIVSFALCWIPVGGQNQLINTIWIFVWALVFFASYTMCLIAFYGSLASVCADERQRLHVSSYKAFFDTISYCIVYALVPLLLEMMRLHIDRFALICLPLMLTILIPLFLIKEGAKYGYPERQGTQQVRVRIGESIRLTFGNRLFGRWLVVNCCAFFGLQMFLVGMNAMIVGGMGFNGAEMAIVNTCAFAPVPIMLYLFNKLKERKGIRFAYQSCLVSFAVAILSFDFASLYVTGGNKPVQYLIACAGGVLGSWAIGSFFMMPYMIPAQIASVEEKLTHKTHSAMFFAAQAVTTSVVGAVASSLVYENIKMLFIAKGASGIVRAESFSAAAAVFGVQTENVFNLGTLLVPVVVCVMCLAGFLLAFRMPKDYAPSVVAAELKKRDSSLDISGISDAPRGAGGSTGEVVFVQIGLTLLSGFLFGFVWTAFLTGYVKRLTGKRRRALCWVAGTLVPFAAIPVLLSTHAQLKALADARGVKLTGSPALYAVTGALLPILPINIVALSVMQRDINRLLAVKTDATPEKAA